MFITAYMLKMPLPGPLYSIFTFELPHEKNNKVACAHSKDSDQPGPHTVWSESSLSAWRKLGSLATHWVHSEDWSDWAHAQADLSLRGVHTSFCWFHHEVAHLFLYIFPMLMLGFCDSYGFQQYNKATSHEPLHDKTNKMTAFSEDSDQPLHPPSLIKFFSVPSMGN